MATTTRQEELMNTARAGSTFDSYKLTCIIYNGWAGHLSFVLG
jgi:hypothetical protein